MELLPKPPTTKGPAQMGPDTFMVHTAIWEDDDATGGDHVTDEEYTAR